MRISGHKKKERAVAQALHPSFQEAGLINQRGMLVARVSVCYIKQGTENVENQIDGPARKLEIREIQDIHKGNK